MLYHTFWNSNESYKSVVCRVWLSRYVVSVTSCIGVFSCFTIWKFGLFRLWLKLISCLVRVEFKFPFVQILRDFQKVSMNSGICVVCGDRRRRAASSAKRVILFFGNSGKSFMNRRNRNGLEELPWGTPVDIALLDVTSSTLASNLLSNRTDLMIFTNLTQGSPARQCQWLIPSLETTWCSCSFTY